MNNRLKVLKKVIKNMSNSCEIDDFLDNAMETYLNEFHDPVTKPKGKKNYLGIEIECFTPLQEGEVMELLLSYDLEKYVDVGEDGSIEPDNGECEYELRVLVPENELTSVMKKLGKFFKKGRFKVNDTCGLHVHIDMRHRDVEKCYNKLLKFQDILFGVVNKDRWNSEYCNYSTINSQGSRFTAINRVSYEKHRTLEVRLHQGCVDVKKIQNWIKLLLKAITYKSIPAVESKADVLKFIRRDKKIQSYVKKEFKESWFKSRKDVVNGNCGDNDNYDEEMDY